MKIPLSVRFRALFARDKDAFWWKHFTDEELELKRMDVWELAAIIEEAAVRPGMMRKRIVAEHMLSVRLAKIQSSASWGAGLLGFVGAIIGAALSVALAGVVQTSQPTRIASDPAVEKSRVPATSLSALPAPAAAASAASQSAGRASGPQVGR